MSLRWLKFQLDYPMETTCQNVKHISSLCQSDAEHFLLLL